MKTTILGYPRIGLQRELKKACEKFWKGQMTEAELMETGKIIRRQNWQLQQEAGIDLIPSNDFSFYDQVLDMSLTVGCIPKRYRQVQKERSRMELYFAMARGLQSDGLDLHAMEMTKWFDTNYHYIVPEFEKDQSFELFSTKTVDEFREALDLGIKTKPVIIGPVTYLLLGKERSENFHRIDLLERLLPVYFELFEQLQQSGAEYLQVDEPCLALDLAENERQAIKKAYTEIARRFPQLNIVLASYFDCYRDNLDVVLSLPVRVLHLDLVRCPSQLADILDHSQLRQDLILSLGVVDGRNIWKNDYQYSLRLIQQAAAIHGSDNLWISSSCSLLHCPLDLDLESGQGSLTAEIKGWMAFAKQKLDEIVMLKKLASTDRSPHILHALEENKVCTESRSTSTLIHNQAVKTRVANLTPTDSRRTSPFSIRQTKQRKLLHLPHFPTTTIGSFPQTKEVRSWRAKLKKGELNQQEYEELIKKETEATIRFQEEAGLDVLVHGEFERNDMVEYFGEHLAGFAFTEFGWVQSYGSRCVKPPVIYGDVSRKGPMTTQWSAYAQSLTAKPVKGMLTGPVTILQWSFVRNDQPRSTTCRQIALAIRDEVIDLENAGIGVIQIDEPAIREGLPLRRENRQAYLDWAVECFRIATSGVSDNAQIHTHMCYSEFNDIIDSIAAMDADVITIETSRSAMELLDAFVDFQYPNEIGPGVYDIHSPRVPEVGEMEELLEKASQVLPPENLWVNPDCGLKTRDWPETKAALENMVQAARRMREKELVKN